MFKAARFFVGLGVFLASYAILTFQVAPLLTQKGGGTPLDEAAIDRFPVAIVIRRASDAAKPVLDVVQMRNLQGVTAKAESYSFLLPAGSNKFADQDGDPASYSAEEISPGRQRIRLQAKIGDYTHDVEYEAQDKKVFPLRASHTDPKLGLWMIPISILLTWIVLRLIRRREENAPLA